MEITIALAQMAIVPGEPDANLRMAQALAEESADRGADLLMLPELWLTGYDLKRAVELAAPLDEGSFAHMADLARRYRIHLVGTALEARPGSKPFNTSALYGPDGRRLGAYRKVHLWAPLGEVEHMSAGEEMPVFDWPWGRVALAICYDLRFPELWRRFALSGAQLVLIPSEWPVGRIEHWRLLLRARAVENQFFVTGCNRAGAGTDGDYGGFSAAVDPWGQAVTEGGAEPGLYFATLELGEVEGARRLFPFLADRRAEVYG
ncbi:MAG: carbon-nitrogen family hydrolase [Anaerolineae bacterium]|nr:carbon-nitrogen family hydrolase [Anaerolineae bacterium]